MYYEATTDQRVLALITGYFRYQLKARAMDNFIAEAFLLELVGKIMQETTNWSELQANNVVTDFLSLGEVHSEMGQDLYLTSPLLASLVFPSAKFGEGRENRRFRRGEIRQKYELLQKLAPNLECTRKSPATCTRLVSTL